jgi:phage tail sheath protein FI
MYLHPGVYIEEIPSGSRPIEAASTSTALIIGYATKGPLNTPTLLFSFDQYASQFGGIVDFHGSSVGQTVDYMGHTVRAFFNNGGGKAYIVRLAGAGSAPAKAKLIVPLGSAASVNDIDKYLSIQAANPGVWANGLEFRAVQTQPNPLRYSVSVGRTDSQGNFVPSEAFADVSLDPADAKEFVATNVNGTSAQIKIEPVTLSSIPAGDKTKYMIGSLTSGDLSGLKNSDFSALDTKSFDVTINPGNPAAKTAVVVLAVPTSLADIAAQIESDVRNGAVADDDSRKLFTCKVEKGKLVLRSGIPDATASVAVAVPAADATKDARPALKLDGAGGAVAQTGAQAFLATFSNTSSATLAGGADGGLPASADYEALLPQLRKLRDISIMLVPGQTWSAANVAGKGIIDVFKGHAEQMKNRMLIIDPAEGLTFTSSLSFLNEGFPTSTYTATYYPWLEVANPYYHAELRPDRARTVFVPPSGFAAGLWAKTDGRRGVWKAPAGLQSGLTGAANTKLKIGDDEQDQLNPVGVNCYRRIISDIVVWGSRTLATKSDPEWRYIPVRRTAMMLEESIYQGIQWAVFEPNDHRLWSSLRLNIGGFMGTLFRAGAFQGEKASDAYFVRCGLGDTMTQAEIDAGQVIVLVGFAPLKPAEFVIVRIQQIVGKQ